MPCDTVPTRAINVFVHGLLALYMYGRVIIRQLYPILPGCGGSWTLPPGAAPATRWLYEPQPISNQPVGSGLHTVQSGIDPGDHRLRPRHVGVVDAWKYFWSGDGLFSSPDAAGPRRCPEGHSIRPNRSEVSRWGRGWDRIFPGCGGTSLPLQLDY